MPGSKTNFLENELLDHALGTGSYTMPAQVYVGLFTVAPTDAGGGTEVSGNAYARQAVDFDVAASGATQNTAITDFPAATPGNWGSIVAGALFDAASAGNMLYWFDLDAARTINAGDIFRFAAGAIDITED